MWTRPVEKYVDRYAEPEAELTDCIEQRFGHVLTIPAYGEGPELCGALASIPAGPRGPVLIVVVINARVNSPDWVHRANQALLTRLRVDCGPSETVAQGVELLEHPRGNLLLVDRATPGRELPPRGGVGLARKIAADIALRLWAGGSIQSPWIHCTDADVRLPPDYFERGETGAPEAAAILYPFRHSEHPSAWVRRAMLEYEISLRYYVCGLQSARSPYAFHAIGSTIAVRADAYAQVRGFPKRLAAEDFYLLNKVAKVGSVHALDGEPLLLSSRISERTPFGTGRALRRLRDQDREGSGLRIYHPDVFAHLGVWLTALEALAEGDAENGLERLLAKQASARPAVNLAHLMAALDSIGALEAARHGAARRRSPATRSKHLRDAFDAARTLKLIHALRNGALPSLPLSNALESAPFLNWAASEGLEAARTQLEAREASRRPRWSAAHGERRHHRPTFDSCI